MGVRRYIRRYRRKFVDSFKDNTDKAFSYFYIKLFSYKCLRNKNDYLLNLALKVRGYNRSESYQISGESFFINNVLKSFSPKVCVDVGANSGSYSEAILLACEDAVVYAFEPLEEPLKELKVLESKYKDRLIVTNKGVGSKNETLTMYFEEGRTILASFYEDMNKISYVENKLTKDIELVTLDSFFLEENKVDRIDFIKIDTEGFEYEVLVGASEVLKKFKPKIIQIEFNQHHMHRGLTLLSFSEIFPDHEVFQLTETGLIKRDPLDPMSNIYDFSNFAFIEKNKLCSDRLVF